MNTSRTNPKAEGPGRPAPAGGYRLTAFPREFEKSLVEGLDRRFLTIFIACFVAVYAYVIYLANMHFPEEALAEQIKNKYLQEFYAAEFDAPLEEVVEEEGIGLGEEVGEQEEEQDVRAQRDEGRRAEATGTSAAERRAQRRAQAAQRSRQRAAMEQAVAGTGILAELSAGGGGGSGDAVYDVLGDGGGAGIGDLDQVLSGVGGLQTASSGSQRSVLGARSSGSGRSGGAGIDDLIEGGVGPSSSVSIQRQGKFSIRMEEGTVSGKGSRASSRTPEVISRTVNRHADAIENCYKREARINPNLKGSITVQFTIRPNGTVTGARVIDSTLRSKKVENCVISRIRRWRFEKIGANEGDVSFRQKYIFSS